MTSLAAVADELYALDPDEFTAARDAAAKAARDDGDRELATAVKQLRKPPVGAWLVNCLARTKPDRLDELLDLGESLRAAQDALDGAELRSMSKQRHQVVRALSDLAASLAADSGRKAGDAARREVEATLDAALADERAAHAVRTGRLMRPLTSTGLEAVDLADAVAAPDETAPPRRPAAKKATTPTKATAKPDPKQRAAERAVADAEAELARRDDELAAREHELGLARDALGAARAAVADAEAALTAATEQQRVAEAGRRGAEQAAKVAARARANAQRNLETARRKVRR